jgi:hypothetical protein
MTMRNTAPIKNLDATLVRVSVPVPPMLEAALGYRGDARFVAFSWTPYGDEAEYNDGSSAGTGAWDGFLAFVRHPRIQPAVTRFHFGSSEQEAQHTLLLDRDKRELFVAPAAHTDELLRHQWPHLSEENSIQLSPAEAASIVRTAIAKSRHATHHISADAIMQHLQAHRALLQEMKTWLDQQPQPAK